VFEQLLDDEGRVLARECEAHSGLHVDPRVHHEMSDGEVLVNGRPSGITVREATGLCGCGGFGPRLLDAGPATSAFTRLPLESVHDKTSDSCGPADDKRDCLRSGAGQI
jgi:hypothetical protein